MLKDFLNTIEVVGSTESGIWIAKPKIIIPKFSEEIFEKTQKNEKEISLLIM